MFAYFAAGCFWGVQSSFEAAPITDSAVGYMGGASQNPNYEEVCSGQSGHAETLKVVFDPKEINFSALLEVFWACHDPSQVNRQGLDVGTQYRSAIFCTDRDQLELATAAKEALMAVGQKIATEIIPPPPLPFFMAEGYHQNYFGRITLQKKQNKRKTIL